MIPTTIELLGDLCELAEQGKPLSQRLASEGSVEDHWLLGAAACDAKSAIRFDTIFRALREPENSSSTASQNWLGAFGFLCFQCAAEEKDAKKGHARANQILEDVSVAAFIDDYYGIDSKYHVEGLWLHRGGTTSFILKGKTPGADYAIKVLKPWYLSHPKIREATFLYRQRYGGIAQRDPSVAPEIYHSSERCVVMKFIEGKTLGEAMSTRALGPIKRRFQLLDLLLKAMRTCAANDIVHCDLSPENIILAPGRHFASEFQGQDQPEVRPMLIDFGFNYVLLELTGGAAALTRKERYLDPGELLEHPEEAGVLSDIYSLGILFIDVLLASEDRSDDRGIGHDLDQLWQKFPEVAPLVEDMIDKNERNRLLGFHERTEQEQEQGTNGNKRSQVYEYVLERLNMAGELHLDLSEKQSVIKGTFFTAVGQIAGNALWDKLVEEAKTFKISRDISLLTWASIATLLHLATITLFMWFMYQDFNSPGALPVSFPGRFVALTFSVVAAQYYVRVFAGLQARDVDFKTNVSMRCMAVLPWLAIWYALIFSPPSWPYCSAAGISLVGLNNLICFRTARRAISQGKRIFRLPSSSGLDHFLLRMTSWWATMFAYALCLLAVGVLLQIRRAHDEWVYAMVVAVIINLFILFWQCCTKESPTIVGGLQRSLVILRRARQQANRV